ncbi:uncharacterized protein OCT59_021044 [Rhizophagus irregularis]|uniref:uncharacterized protein n=1 Tax=Rhizophagus irregularis TaxID=588596 RepID=UPI003331EE94|nr:hypothetical protein OCT59_021044 [Rhizophagus irregularis]
MSLNRRTCGTHQSEFSRKEINHHLKPVPNWNPGFTNSKSSHANFLYDLWQHRWKNEIFSNRLGIQYNAFWCQHNPHYLDAQEIATLGDFLPPLGKPAPLYYGHNPVDPTKLNSSYYLQYNPNQPDLPPSIEIRIANRLDLDSSDANGMGTTLKHFYRQALSTRQITVWTKQYHKYMKQPPPPPMPSKKKQKHKWKKWMEKHQDYDDFMSKPYTYKPFTPDKYHTDLFGLVSYTSDETKTVEYHPNKRDITTNPSVLSTSHDNKRPRPANSYLPDSLFTSLNSN